MSRYFLTDENEHENLVHPYYIESIANPLVPLIAFVVLGLWISWPLFLLSGIAAGSPTLKREALLILTGFLGVYLFVEYNFVAIQGSGAGYVDNGWLLALLAWKTLITVGVYHWQSCWRQASCDRQKRRHFPLIFFSIALIFIKQIQVDAYLNDFWRYALAGVLI
ncbi:hypothetical protein ONV78_13925 [Hahella sp. CR1]|uniref:hypothetical protein n=1 Tax=Hahella sp. CR1 TaxID=2992807 RepID=UPI00244209E2|nr:hypothetical protein [Hahella sp. CR1]MDG9668837.1 hypothetical protein [Hahella sp. CR1]